MDVPWEADKKFIAVAEREYRRNYHCERIVTIIRRHIQYPFNGFVSKRIPGVGRNPVQGGAAWACKVSLLPFFATCSSPIASFFLPSLPP